MGLEEARRRLEATKQSADKLAQAQQTGNKERVDAYNVAVTALGPSLLRFRCVAARQRSAYKALFGAAYRRQSRVSWGKLVRLNPDFVARYSVAPKIDVLFYGDGDIMLEVGTVTYSRGVLYLAVSLVNERWRIRRGLLSGSDYAQSGDYNYVTCLTNLIDERRFRNSHGAKRPGAYSEGEERIEDILTYWSQETPEEIRQAVDELIVIYLDYYGIPYSEVEG